LRCSHCPRYPRTSGLRSRESPRLTFVESYQGLNGCRSSAPLFNRRRFQRLYRFVPTVHGSVGVVRNYGSRLTPKHQEYNARRPVKTSASFGSFIRHNFFRTNKALIVKTLVSLMNDTLAAGPVVGKRATKSVVAMPAMSDSSDRHSETDRCSTVLEVLFEHLRRLVVARFLFQPSDVLPHACADECLPTQARKYSIPGSSVHLNKRQLEAACIAFRDGLRFARRRPSRDNFNPHSRTFSIT
jgi:hypothetical protein